MNGNITDESVAQKEQKLTLNMPYFSRGIHQNKLDFVAHVGGYTMALYSRYHEILTSTQQKELN